MALLTTFFLISGFLLAVPSTFAEPNVAIVYDGGRPEASVAVVDKELLEIGSHYEGYEVIGFDDKAVIVKELSSADFLRWPVNGEIAPVFLKKAQHLFIAKQMREIYRAQIKYLERFESHFAPDLAALIDQELLDNDFQDGEKQGYRFRIAETGLTSRTAPDYERKPTFYAIAEPLEPEEGKLCFFVDSLGQVRFSPDLNTVTWGPVWDYVDWSAPRSRVIFEGDI